MDFVFLRIATQLSGFLNCFKWDNENHVKLTLKSNPEFLFSIYLASSQLFEALDAYIRSDKSDRGMLRTIYKYVSRNTHRATPFGNFAGVGIAHLAESTEISGIGFMTHAELDIHIRQKLFEILKPKGGLLRSNTSITPSGPFYNYFERTGQDYRLSRVRKSPEINQILRRAKQGINEYELADLGTDKELIEAMIQEQLLVSEFQPHPTETSVAWLKRIQAALPALYTKEIETIAERLEITKVNLSNLQKTAKSIQKLVNEPNPFYINCSFEASKSTVDSTYIKSVVSTLSELEPLFMRSEPAMLTRFKQQFFERYGDAEVPLLQVLDPESGLMYGYRQEYGYEDFLNSRGGQNRSKEPDLGLFSIQKTLWSKAMKFNLHAVELDRVDLPSLLNPTYSSTYYAIGEPVDEDKFLLKTLGGATAYSIMGRFSGLSPFIKKEVDRIVSWDRPAADLIYLPPGGEGNVTLHQSSGRPQIHYLASGDSQIHISELMLSVRDGREIVLSHKGKPLKVLIPTAHNYHRSLPVVRFLGDLQFQGDTVNFSWSWGVLAEEPFLPRVTYKNIVLSPAVWNRQPHETLDAMLLRLPKEVRLKQGDNELYLNLNHTVCREILEKEMKKNIPIQLGEVTQSTFVKNIGHHTEVIIPLRKAISKTPIPNEVRKQAKQWVYFKLYARPGTVENILIARIPAIVRSLGVPWFFVRFEDHLRIRFLMPDTTLGTVLDILRAGLKAENRIYSIQPDIYFQENDRYSHIELAEEVFYRDSEHTLKVIRAVTNAERMSLAIQKMEGYVKAAGLTQEEQRYFCEQQRDAYLNEQSDLRVARQSLNAYYRSFTYTPCKEGKLSRKLEIALTTLKPSKKILASLIHMSINRLFVQDQRALEMLAYHILWKKLRSSRT